MAAVTSKPHHLGHQPILGWRMGRGTKAHHRRQKPRGILQQMRPGTMFSCMDADARNTP